MTPAQYATEIVVPTIIEFRGNRWDRRRAYLACIVTYHLADFVAEELGTGGGPEPVRKKVGLTVEFQAVEALNVAAKHAIPRMNRRARIIGLIAGREKIWYPSFAGLARAGATFAGDKVGGVKVTIDGRGHDAYYSVCQVVRSFRTSYPALFQSVNWQGLIP